MARSGADTDLRYGPDEMVGPVQGVVPEGRTQEEV